MANKPLRGLVMSVRLCLHFVHESNVKKVEDMLLQND